MREPKPSLVAMPMWPGAGAGWEKDISAKPRTSPNLKSTVLPKYSILDLPSVMFKLNIPSFSLQAQLPSGMTSVIIAKSF